MSSPLHAVRARILATTISTLQGMMRFKKARDAKAIQRIIAELQDKLAALKKQG